MENRGVQAPARATSRPGGSETADERDASFLGTAEEPVLAGVAPVRVSPTAVRAVEAELIRLRFPAAGISH
jgi:hypothetical protein